MPRREIEPAPALELIAARFRALGDEARLRLLALLREGEATVSEMTARTGMTQSNVSRHIQRLCAAGVLGRRKEGLWTYYRIIDRGIFRLCEEMCGTIQKDLDEKSRALSRFKG